MTPAKNKICLWYDGGAEEAARFYAETFPDFSVGAVHRAPADFSSGKKGDRTDRRVHNSMAVIHLFCFQDDEIVEMWSVGQQVLEDSPNENGMF